jgi:methyl-accepting chemotaxis protein
MQNRRRGFSFRSALKLRMTRQMLFLASFSLLVLGLCVLFFFLWGPIPRQLLLIADPHAQSSARIFGNTVRSLFIFFFVLNILFLWLISVVARSVLGPFVRINRVLEELAGGNLPKDVRFRKNDEAPFQQLVEPLNRALDHLRARREELKVIIDELDSTLAEGRTSGFSESSLAKLQELRTRVDKLTEGT